MQGVILWLAQGLGIGRIPFAPGTFGSALGLLWVMLLLATANFWLYLTGLVVGIALSVWLCGWAEKILKQTDPSSVVLDEVAAMPLCFLGLVATDCLCNHRVPKPESLLNHENWILTAIIFVLFRFFDILKPWPVRQSQALPGGWGVTVDDLLAAMYVNVLTLPFLQLC